MLSELGKNNSYLNMVIDNIKQQQIGLFENNEKLKHDIDDIKISNESYY